MTHDAHDYTTFHLYDRLNFINGFILYQRVRGSLSLHHVQAFFIPSPFKDDLIKAMKEEIKKLKEREMWKIKRCFVRIPISAATARLKTTRLKR